MAPKISVIIPAFNAELFIADAIESVLAQEYSSETEIIVIDDGSSDNTRMVVSDIAAHNSQIILLRNDRKKGPSGARNTGLLNANGDYVTFLDADDLWLKNHLEEGVAFLDKNNTIDIVFYNFEVQEYETKRKIFDWFSERNFSKIIKIDELDDKYNSICDDLFKALLNESFMHLQSMIIRKKVLSGILFDEEIKRSEDRDFCINIYLNSNAKFAYKNLITGIYYRHSNSLTSKTVEKSLSTTIDHIYLFKKYLSLESISIDAVNELKRKLFRSYLTASYYYRILNMHRLAFGYLFHSYRYGIAVSQLKELAKISASCVLHNIFGSSAESVGSLWIRKVTKSMI